MNRIRTFWNMMAWWAISFLILPIFDYRMLNYLNKILFLSLSAFILTDGSSALGSDYSLLVKNGWLVTLSEETEESFVGFLLVDSEGRIAKIGVGEPDPEVEAASVVNAKGKIVMPGFLSGHSHPWQSAWRGLTPDGELWPWLTSLHFTYTATIGEGDWYAFALHGDLDHLRHGITTWIDYSQRFGAPEDVYLEQFQADIDSGGHFVFSYVMDINTIGDAGPGGVNAFLERKAGTSGSERCLRVNLNSVGTHFNKEVLKLEVAIAHEQGWEMHFHYLETPSMGDSADHFSWFEETGALKEKLVFAHFIHPNDEILRKSASAGAAMIWNPLSNGRLASGLPDIPHYLEMGIKVGMGVDGQASADLADPFENMRMGLYALRMKHQSAKVMQPIDILRLHTIRTAEILGVAFQVGNLEEGKFADFLIIDPQKPGTGPINDPVATLVFSCSANNIEAVYVAGKAKVLGGEVLGHDSRALAAEVVRRRDAVIARRPPGPPKPPFPVNE